MHDDVAVTNVHLNKQVSTFSLMGRLIAKVKLIVRGWIEVQMNERILVLAHWPSAFLQTSGSKNLAASSCM